MTAFVFDSQLGRISYHNGSVMFFDEKSRLHRESGPAVFLRDGHESWHYKNILHRVDGPAVIYDAGEYWYLNGVQHREGGPAVVRELEEEWWVNGELHREDGPAIIYSYGREEYWVDGKQVRVCNKNVKKIDQDDNDYEVVVDDDVWWQ